MRAMRPVFEARPRSDVRAQGFRAPSRSKREASKSPERARPSDRCTLAATATTDCCRWQTPPEGTAASAGPKLACRLTSRSRHRRRHREPLRVFSVWLMFRHAARLETASGPERGADLQICLRRAQQKTPPQQGAPPQAAWLSADVFSASSYPPNVFIRRIRTLPAQFCELYGATHSDTNRKTWLPNADDWSGNGIYLSCSIARMASGVAPPARKSLRDVSPTLLASLRPSAAVSSLW